MPIIRITKEIDTTKDGGDNPTGFDIAKALGGVYSDSTKNTNKISDAEEKWVKKYTTEN